MNEIRKTSVTRETTIREALQTLDDAGTGVLLLHNEAGRFERTVTDGDVRRLILAGATLSDTLAALPSRESITLAEKYSRQDVLELMNRNSISHIPVVNDTGQVIRVVDRKDVDGQILLSSPHLGEQERTFVEEAFQSNWIAPLGPNVDAFERELAICVGVKHAAAVSSGTAAIHLALILLGVKHDDVVFCSALTFAASANPIVYQGAIPVFIDSEPDSWNMSPVALEEAFAWAVANHRLPRAVIVVNLYGQSANFDPIREICGSHGVPIIEDAAESLGAYYKDRSSGTLGHIGVFSFNGNKIITTSGGGMIVSDDHDLIARARFLATQAREPALHYEHREIGYNYRMSNILAGVGRGQLNVLSERVEARRNVFERYRRELADIPQLQWMPEPSWSRSNRWLTACILVGRDAEMSANSLIKRLASERIEARPVWKPMQLQPVFSESPYFSHKGDSVSERLFNHGICLPSGSNLSVSQQTRVIEMLREILKGS